jgi:hypothetical protein
MVRKIKITRHGMTTCPTCHAHIRVAAKLADTVCVFCSTALKDVLPAGDLGRLSGLARIAHASRSGVVAASILGLTGLAGCENNVQPVYGAPADILVPDTAKDAGPQPEYGLPADVFPSDAATDIGQDALPQPAYGIPADAMEPDIAPDAGPQPEYGMPADIGESKDATEDVGPQPPYGIPADVGEPADAESDVESDASDAMEAETVEDAGFAPEYGLPPDAA